MKEKLIIFTRYPVPGQTKTRLIPALGNEGAAKIHSYLAKQTIAQIKPIEKARPLVSVEVHFTGGSQQQMQEWLGLDIIYQHQGTGDLGARMASAFQLSFQLGFDRIVTIGTDCPDLNSNLLGKAFDDLDRSDLVLGPARDGGYYLIGLRHFIPELFQGIHWGTDKVFQQTIAIAQTLHLLISYLPPLTDIDRPEDLSSLPLGWLDLHD